MIAMSLDQIGNRIPMLTMVKPLPGHKSLKKAEAVMGLSLCSADFGYCLLCEPEDLPGRLVSVRFI